MSLAHRMEEGGRRPGEGIAAGRIAVRSNFLVQLLPGRLWEKEI